MMLMSTLPDLPERTYKEIGVVFNSVILNGGDQTALERAFKDIEQQATNMGADAVIDIKITPPGTISVTVNIQSSRADAIVVVTGTAVKIL